MVIKKKYMCDMILLCCEVEEDMEFLGILAKPKIKMNGGIDRKWISWYKFKECM